VDKLERDGQVAVLVSQGFGAGWSTWNPEYPEMLFDPYIATIVADATEDSWERDISKITTYCTLKYPDAYLGGLAQLTVQWVPKGELFRVEDYDGSETLRLVSQTDWITA
jgi:hypothetical protein